MFRSWMPVFYTVVKPLMPRRLQIALRRRYAGYTRRHSGRGAWPIDPQGRGEPPGWAGWPEGKRFALVLTHDVEKPRGVRRCLQLAELESRLGFRSVFNFVPEDYPLPADLRRQLEERKFEIGVHGLRHDGSLYRSWPTFHRQALEINRYLREWSAVGFRSPAMHHNLEWLRELDICYDCSTFDTDPFEPQSDGVRTIFPFRVAERDGRPGYVEMPYTLPQDHTLFVVLREKGIRIWKEKLDWIAGQGGMALLDTHPDYMCFGPGRMLFDEYPVRYYREFLKYVESRYGGKYWHALPREVAGYAKAMLDSLPAVR